MLLLQLSIFVIPSVCIRFMTMKNNIQIPNNTYYIYSVGINQSMSDFSSFKDVVFEHSVTNSMETTSQYFDYFTYMSQNDFNCYNNSVGNMSYFYQCSFLLHDSPNIRVNHGNNINNFTEFNFINSGYYKFIIDNTPYPFPQGAQPFSNISISFSAKIQLKINDQFRTMGIRLLFVNSTVLIIYFTAILLIYLRINKLTKLMKDKNVENIELKNRISELSKDIDQDSQPDNYQEIMQNQFSMRSSKDGRGPSLISSSPFNQHQ